METRRLKLKTKSSKGIGPGLLTLTLMLHSTMQSGMLLHMDVTDRALRAFKSDDPNQYPYAEVL